MEQGQDSMNYIFGKDAKGEIDKTRNGLWLPANFEENFDKFKVVICYQPSSPI